jgi:hypothetical protein
MSDWVDGKKHDRLVNRITTTSKFGEICNAIKDVRYHFGPNVTRC